MALRRDGSEFPVELKCSIIRDTNNLPLASVSVINDISYRKKIEETYNFLLNAGWNKGEEDFFSAC